MPDHKNQHYVPRCYLKPFSVDGGGAAINVFNIQRSRAIRNAPVKGQCAKDYLYGVNLELEKALQFFEGEYARIIRIVQSSAGQPSVQELQLLLGFAFLQYQRTDMAMQRMRMVHERMHNAIYEGRKITSADLDVSDRTMMLMSMSMFSGNRENIEDLKVCIVRNETDIDFVTSDDPAVLVSKYHAQRLGTSNFGIGSSGALLILPLTLRLCLMAYDGDVYTISGKQGCFASITKRADAHALNELQYLKAAENVYFSRWDDRERIGQEFGTVNPRRPEWWHRITVLVPDGLTERGERYRRATDEERRTAPNRVFITSYFHPIPSAWMSTLKYRDPIRTCYDGSAAGHVRKAVWIRDRARRLLAQ